MKTFFTVKFALLPLAIFIILAAYGLPAPAVVAGLIVSIIVAAWRLRSGEIKNLELAVVVIFAALCVGLFLFPDVVRTEAIALAFVGLTAYATATVILGRPWTAEFSRGAYPGAASSPVFVRINMILSAFWAALFLLIAVAEELNGGLFVKTAIVAIGAVASIYGPKLLIKAFGVERG